MADWHGPKRRKIANGDTWRQDATCFHDLLSSMYANKIGTDVIIKVESGDKKTEIQCHSAVLVGHSPVLAAMLSSRWSGPGLKDYSNPSHKTITFTDDNPECFTLFVDLMYTNWSKYRYKCHNFANIPNEFTPAITVAVLSLAHKYLAYQIIRRCKHFINVFLLKQNERITVELYSHLRALPICDEGEVARGTLRNVENFLLQYARQILNSDAVLGLSHSDLIQIVQQQKLLCPEGIVYNGCIRWAKEQCNLKELPTTGKNLRFVLGEELINFIRFPCLDSEIITGQVLQILTEEETVELLKYKLNPACPDFEEKPIRFCDEERDAICTCQVIRLDAENVSNTTVDFSQPHGFQMTASRNLDLSCLSFGFYMGEKDSDYQFNVKVEIKGDEFTGSESVTFFKEQEGEIIFVKLVRRIFIPSGTSIEITFHIEGGPTFVSQDIATQETTEIVTWENFGGMALTFKSIPTIPNGLMQIPIINFGLWDDVSSLMRTKLLNSILYTNRRIADIRHSASSSSSSLSTTSDSSQSSMATSD